MRTTWPTDPRALAEAAGPGWGGLWSLLYTAERAVAALGQVVSFAEGMDLLWLGAELRQAADDAARSHPGDVAAAVAVDLGPLSERDDATRARRLLVGLVAAVIERADDLLAGDPPTDDAIELTGIASMAFSIRIALTGGAR